MESENAEKLRGCNIPGFESYVVWRDGRIWSTTTMMFLKPYLNGRPGRQYPTVRIQEDGRKRTFKVHRLVATLFIPNPDGLPEVNHKDGNKLNCHADNLEWVTSGDNRRHAYATGLDSQAGERNGNAKLTADQVRKIRAFKGHYTSAELGLLVGVSASYIRQIWSGSKWRDTV